MEKRCCDALRRLARQAKNRLGKKDYIEGKGYKVYSGGLVADYKLIQINRREEERFYQKVSEILTENIDTVNPIGKLVDKSKLKLMSDIERERYIMNLADKYIKMKQRFEKEQSNLNSMEFVV